jgi:carboxylesterase
MPTTEPFLYPGNRTGCVLVHGITATPKEMSYLGAYLAEKGHSVVGVRLAGHATDPADLRRVRYRDWLASVEDGWNLLKGSTDRIFLIGLSMGGALVMTQAARLPAAGVVAMSTPYQVEAHGYKRLLLPFTGLLRYLMPYQKKGQANWFNKAAYQQRVAYKVGVTNGYHELKGLLAEMRAGLPKITAPVRLIHSKDDDYVLPYNMQKIYADLGTADKEMCYVEQAEHVITEDGEREKVFALVAEFVERVIVSEKD